jgi:hypothetical protein
VKIPGRVSSVVRGFATSEALAVRAVFSTRVLAVQPTAGDVSAQSADSLNITGSTAGVTPQPSAERGWLSDFHVSGFVSPTFGIYEPPHALNNADNVFARGPVRSKAGPGTNFGVGSCLSSVRNGSGSDEVFCRCT